MPRRPPRDRLSQKLTTDATGLWTCHLLLRRKLLPYNMSQLDPWRSTPSLFSSKVFSEKMFRLVPIDNSMPVSFIPLMRFRVTLFQAVNDPETVSPRLPPTKKFSPITLYALSARTTPITTLDVALLLVILFQYDPVILRAVSAREKVFRSTTVLFA